MIIKEAVPEPMFARHETFHLRHMWLKKAYNGLQKDGSLFLREDATVRLGVGKNMVGSIRFWCQAYKVIEREKNALVTTELGHRILAEGGLDHYLERPQTLWLLHWLLFAPPCYITKYNLPSGVTGKTEYELHCTDSGWWWCNSEDSHFEKMIVKINDNSAGVKFRLAEDASAEPKEYDVRKTLGHELFHAMGIGHNSSSNSTVYYTYVFGAGNGYTATTTDRDDLGGRYP